jgi:hypothetical protein
MKKSIIALSVLAGLGLTGCGDSDLIRAVKDNTVAVKDAAIEDTRKKTNYNEFKRIKDDLVAGVSPLDSITKEEWQWLANFVKGQEKNIKLYKDHVADHELEDHTVKILFTDETVLNDELLAYLTFVNDIYSKAKVHANLTRGLTAKEAGIVSKLEITESTGLTGADVQKFIQLLPKGFEGATNQAKYRKLMNAAIGVLKLDKTVEEDESISLSNQDLIDELEYKMTMDIGTTEQQVEVMLTQVDEGIQNLVEEIKDPKKQLDLLDSVVALGTVYANGTKTKEVIDSIDDLDAKIKAIDFFVLVEKGKKGNANIIAEAIAGVGAGKVAPLVAALAGSGDEAEVKALVAALVGAGEGKVAPLVKAIAEAGTPAQVKALVAAIAGSGNVAPLVKAIAEAGTPAQVKALVAAIAGSGNVAPLVKAIATDTNMKAFIDALVLVENGATGNAAKAITLMEATATASSKTIAQVVTAVAGAQGVATGDTKAATDIKTLLEAVLNASDKQAEILALMVSSPIETDTSLNKLINGTDGKYNNTVASLTGAQEAVIAISVALGITGVSVI